MTNEKESKVQKRIIDKIKTVLPDSLVLKNDASYIQGIADLSIIWEGRAALLEVKREEDSSRRPNQEYYLELQNSQYGFGRFISKDNEDEVLNELFEYFNG